MGRAKKEEPVFDIESISRYQKETTQPFDWKAFRFRAGILLAVVVLWGCCIAWPMHHWLQPSTSQGQFLLMVFNLLGMSAVEFFVRTQLAREPE